MPDPQSFKLPSWAGAGANSPTITEKRVTTPDGTVHVFPAATPDDVIFKVTGLDRTTAGDLLDTGKGFFKGAARTAIDLARPTLGALTAIPQVDQALSDARANENLQPENPRQQAGMFGFDVGSAFMPTTWATKAARGAEIVRPVANRLYRTAVDVSKEGADQLLTRGIGRPTARNARTAYNEVLAGEKGLVRNEMDFESKGGSGASWALKEAADAAEKAKGHAWSPIDVLSAGTARIAKNLTNPMARATYAKGLYHAAPAIQTAAGAVSPALALALAKLFGGQPPDDE